MYGESRDTENTIICLTAMAFYAMVWKDKLPKTAGIRKDVSKAPAEEDKTFRKNPYTLFVCAAKRVSCYMTGLPEFLPCRQ